MIVDAILHPSELSSLASRGLRESVCVVFDVLRATSSIVTGLANGVYAILPAVSIEEALSMRASNPQALLGGERQGEKIEGFDLGNSPLEYVAHPGATIISTTTNGTSALRACAEAQTVLVGAVLNLSAVVRCVRALKPARLLAVCSGTGVQVSLEDAWAVGSLLKQFESCDCTDAARMTIALREAHPEPASVFRTSVNGRALLAKGRFADLEWCETQDRFETVAVLQQGALQPWISAA